MYTYNKSVEEPPRRGSHDHSFERILYLRQPPRDKRGSITRGHGLYGRRRVEIAEYESVTPMDWTAKCSVSGPEVFDPPGQNILMHRCLFGCHRVPSTNRIERISILVLPRVISGKRNAFSGRFINSFKMMLVQS